MFRTAAVIAALAIAAPAQAAELNCPPTIEVAPQTLSGTVPGWQLFFDKADTHYALESVTIYNGPPQNGSALVPDTSDPDYSQWELFNNGVDHYFLTCGYTHTPVQLTRELPPTLKRCRVAYASNVNPDAAPPPYKITCE